MRHKGHGDIKWDQEFTDWEAVAPFAAEAGAASPLGGAMSRTRSTLRA